MRYMMLLSVFFASLATAEGKIVFHFEPVVRVQPGAQAAVPVYVTGTENEPLEAYDLPIDIGGDGRGFPFGLSFAGDDIHNDDYAEEVDSFGDIVISGTEDLPAGPPFDPHFEAVFADDGPTITLSPVRRHLFNILLDIPGDFTGSVPIVIATSGFPNSLNVTTGTDSYDMPIPAVLEFQAGLITAIPEPTAFGLTALFAGMVVSSRRRR